MDDILWRPSPARVQASHMHGLLERAPGEPQTYDGLWEWSVTDLEGFWAAVFDDAGVVAAAPYERVLGSRAMPGAEWFTGARLNYAQNLLRRNDDAVALIGAGEGRADEHVTWAELHHQVAAAQQGLRRLGVEAGDRVAAFMPNCIETVVVMLAATGLGAIWSSCSPDFGPMGVVDRFGQIRPKVLLTADGYRYNGKTFTLDQKVSQVCAALEDLEAVVLVDFVGHGWSLEDQHVVRYRDLLAEPGAAVHFEPVAFDHPLFIMYSSGTTGVPKSIVHGHGGTLLQHLKEHRYHVDLHAESDRLFWFTTCGWMMWNWLVSGLASGVTVVLYDGSPTHPGPETLWQLAQRSGVTHFGTSPKFLAACQQAGLRPRDVADLGAVTSVLSTGSPLLPEQFDWFYDVVGGDVQLASVSGGTDLIGCFAAGAPLLPVRRGELQCRALGMAVEAWDADGKPVIGQKGELVCTQPFPSMPVGFYNDPDGRRYRGAYFEQNPGVWTHGDFIEVRPSGGVVIYGRSDTTLNPGGVRIGTAEIYRALEQVPGVVDAIAVGRPAGGDVDVVLCVKLADGVDLDAALAQQIRDTIRRMTTPRHVPRHVFAVTDIPYTISGKKVETAVRDTITGAAVHNRDALANPESLDEYAALPFD